jgi:hypothetical protein
MVTRLPVTEEIAGSIPVWTAIKRCSDSNVCKEEAMIVHIKS